MHSTKFDQTQQGYSITPNKKSEDEINVANRHGTLESRRELITAVIANQRDGKQAMSELLPTREVDMRAVLGAKAEGEADEKL